MQSTAHDVQTYLQDVPSDRQAKLTALRNLCVTTLEGYEESMAYYWLILLLPTLNPVKTYAA